MSQIETQTQTYLGELYYKIYRLQLQLETVDFGLARGNIKRKIRELQQEAKLLRGE